MGKSRLLGTVAIVAVAVGVPSAQTPASPTFEVVSIKPYGGPLPPQLTGAMVIPATGGRFVGDPITVVPLIGEAFRTPEGVLRRELIVGGPSWITSSRFAIIATVASGTSREALLAQLPGLMRALLEDRFKLRTHTETRILPVYALVKARGDGRLGPKIHESTVDCDARVREQLELLKTSPPAVVAATMASRGQPACSVSSGPNRFLANATTMQGVAGAVSGAVDRPVLDRTGLTGRFDLDLQWTDSMPAGSGDAASGTAPLTEVGPSVFTAVQEQLGLKLEPRQEPMEVLVIDHIEPPTPD